MSPMEGFSQRKRVRDDSDELELETCESPEVKRLKEDLLDNLDESDVCASHELDSFMKSFEEEISASPSHRPDPASESDNIQPDLGYLFEASDDELGLPPSNASPAAEEEEEEYQKENEWVRFSSQFSEPWGFDDQIPSYDSFEFGVGETDAYNYGTMEYMPLEGLFDYADDGLGPSDNLWRSGTLPAQ